MSTSISMRAACYLAAGTAFCVTAVAAQGTPPMEPYVSQSSTVRTLALNSLDVTRDGRYVVYSSHGETFLVDTASGARSPLEVSVADGRPYSAWSPDGTLLAHYQSASGREVPTIWDRESGRTRVTAHAPTCAIACQFWGPAWTPDGRRLLYAAEPVAERSATSGVSEKPPTNPNDEVYGRVRAPDGVIVRQSDQLKRDLGRYQQVAAGAGDALCKGWCQPSEIVAIDAHTGASELLAKGAAFKSVFVAPNGRFAIAMASVPPLPTQKLNRYYTYYLIPLTAPSGSREAKSRSAESADGPTDKAGNPLRVLARNVPHFQRGSASISPSGKYLAYTTTGNSATGDVYLVDLDTAKQMNLTEEVHLPPNPFDANPRKNPTGTRVKADNAGKFGMEFLSPIWSNDGQSVLVVRPKMDAGELRYGFWRVPIRGGKAEPIGMPSTFSLEAVAGCQDGRSSCKFGTEKSILAALRMRQSGGGDRLVIGTIDERSGQVHVIRDVGAMGVGLDMQAAYDFEGAARGEFVLARNGLRAIGLMRPSDAPPDLWQVSSDADGGISAGPMNVLQKERVPPIVVKRLEFTSITGERLGVRIELPADYREGERLPAVMVVYGALRASINPEFNGGDRWYNPLRDARYAVLLPDLPVIATDGGKNCDQMASNATAALDAAAKAGIVDPNRVGVMGHSWGGYSVFCIVSRTDRFKAGLAGAGLSNLFSMGVSGIGGRGGFYELASFASAPWENPQWYIEESPGFKLNNVVTPLMIVYGVRDSMSLPEHSLQMYFGLSDLGRPVQLIGYDDSGHGDMLHYKDYWQRTFEWFDRYLNVTQDEKAARLRP